MGKTDSKRVNLSLPPATYELLLKAAKNEGVSPTRYAAQLVADALNGTLRPAHNPDIANLNKKE